MTRRLYFMGAIDPLCFQAEGNDRDTDWRRDSRASPIPFHPMKSSCLYFWMRLGHSVS